MDFSVLKWDEFMWEDFLRYEDRRQDAYMEYRLRLRKNSLLLTGRHISPKPPNYLVGEFEPEEEWKLSLHPGYSLSLQFIFSFNKALRFQTDCTRQSTAAVEVLAASAKIPILIRTGFYLKTEYDLPAAEIAYCKRSLKECNTLIENLKELYRSYSLQDQIYRKLIREAVALRNAIACYICDIRQDPRSRPNKANR
jgi:hypothetical protein